MKKKNWLISLILVVLILSGCNSIESEKAKEKSKGTEEPTVLYITRHGKTILNTLDRVQGWADTPLTDEGRQVAVDLGKGLKKANISFKSIYSSDLGRAKETAQIITESLGVKNSKIIESDKLREACYGMYEGDLNKNMMGRILKENNMKDPKELTSLGMGMWKLSADTLSKIDELKIAESSDTIINRMTEELTDIAKETYKNGGGNVLVVGHGMSISLFLDSIDSSLNFEGHLPNASISKVSFDGEKFTVETIGDTSFNDK